MFFLHFLFFLFFGNCIAQPGNSGISCPDDGNFNGDPDYLSGTFPKAAPLRGNIGCIHTVNTIQYGGQSTTLKNIYGPLEAGFTTQQMSQLFGCSSATFDIVGGVDTQLAEKIVRDQCGQDINLLEPCGYHVKGSGNHFHERFSCLYTDTGNGHSSKFATALDGNSIYGPYITGGVVPTDLDACNGRFGITPDSGGQEIYYYVVTSTPPFSLGCLAGNAGPITMEQCRSLYPGCQGGDTTYDLNGEIIKTKLECTCYDLNGFNTVQPISTTDAPTGSPTGSPTSNSTVTPTGSPTGSPTVSPTSNSTVNPTGSPTGSPTSNSTVTPSNNDDDGLSGAVIAGITIVPLFALGSFYYYKNKKSNELYKAIV